MGDPTNHVPDFQEIDKNALSVLKGDSIGNTTYSERFVLKTILSLQEVQWSDSLEQDLSMLWDMTSEPDVSLYLQEKGFLQMVPVCIQDNFQNVRLVEILIGIIGNICCNSSGQQMELTNYLLTLLSYDDSCTLEQVIRCLRILLPKQERFIEMLREHETFLDRVSEILESSIKLELLESLIQFLNELSNFCEWKELPNIIVSNKLFESFITSLQDQTRSKNSIELLSTYSSLIEPSNKEPIIDFLSKLINLDLELDEELLTNIKMILVNFNLSSDTLLIQFININESAFLDSEMEKSLHGLIFYLVHERLIGGVEALEKNCGKSMDYFYGLLKKYDCMDDDGGKFEDSLFLNAAKKLNST